MSSLAVIYSRASNGIHAPLVTVEVHLSNGALKFNIVGLPETEVKESRDRVRSALIQSNFEFPGCRITINLAPADLRKEGGRFDLPIALGILAASDQIPANQLMEYEFAGELALSGSLRPLNGIFPFALASQKAKRFLIVPTGNAEEATMATPNNVFAANHLLDVCSHLTKKEILLPYQLTRYKGESEPYPDLNEVSGQHHARRALEIAAAGGHSLLMIGSPGTGKTMLATRLPGILPELTDQEALEVGAIASIKGNISHANQWRKRPFRSPHHTASSVALVGGGNPPRPGEISLAHNGVLFLDELPEFNRHVLECLREPLESGCITISRAARQAEFPAQFQLIAAMNPCPCGYLSNEKGRCRCTFEQIHRYRSRLSGPLMDRIDMHIEVPPLPSGLLMQTNLKPESSAEVQYRVKNARKIQLERNSIVNMRLNGKILEKYCSLQLSDKKFFEEAIEKLELSARAYHRILKVARTIADLGYSEIIKTEHLSEALSYRVLDRAVHEY